MHRATIDQHQRKWSIFKMFSNSGFGNVSEIINCCGFVFHFDLIDRSGSYAQTIRRQLSLVSVLAVLVGPCL